MLIQDYARKRRNIRRIETGMNIVYFVLGVGVIYLAVTIFTDIFLYKAI